MDTSTKIESIKIDTGDKFVQCEQIRGTAGSFLRFSSAEIIRDIAVDLDKVKKKDLAKVFDLALDIFYKNWAMYIIKTRIDAGEEDCLCEEFHAQLVKALKLDGFVNWWEEVEDFRKRQHDESRASG